MMSDIGDICERKAALNKGCLFHIYNTRGKKAGGVSDQLYQARSSTRPSWRLNSAIVCRYLNMIMLL